MNAQSSYSGLSLHTGVSFQTTLTKFYNSTDFPYKSGDNQQGFGLDLGFDYQLKKAPVSFTYFTRFRYDYQYPEQTTWNIGDVQYKDVYGFIFDQNLQVKYHFSKKKNHYVGLSYTFHNPMGTYYVKPSYTNKYIVFKTNFNSIGIVAGQNIYKNLFLEEKIGFVNQFQDLKDLNAFYFSISLKYNFPVKISLAPKVN